MADALAQDPAGNGTACSFLARLWSQFLDGLLCNQRRLGLGGKADLMDEEIIFLRRPDQWSRKERVGSDVAPSGRWVRMRLIGVNRFLVACKIMFGHVADQKPTPH
jgi:hypothetical protein